MEYHFKTHKRWFCCIDSYVKYLSWLLKTLFYTSSHRLGLLCNSVNQFISEEVFC